MKKWFLIRDNLTNKISYYHIMLLLVTLPFDKFYSQLVFASFGLHTLIHVRKSDWAEVWNIKILTLQSVFFIALISLAYTHYLSIGIADVTRLLLVLLIPFFFALSTFNFSKYRDRLLTVFAFTCVCAIVYLYGRAFYTIMHFHLPFRAIVWDAFINHKFSAPLNIHATFFSLQIAIALVYLLLQLLKDANLSNRAFYIPAIIVLSAGIIQLGSKAILLALLIAIIIGIPLLALQGRKRLRFILLSTIIAAFVISGALKARSFKERYVTELRSDLSETTPEETEDTRLDRWQAATEVIAEHPLIGHGSGSELYILSDKFFAKKLYSAYLFKLNAHNQYLSFLLTSGVIGLLIYLVTLAFGFVTAWLRTDVLFITFMLLIATVSVSESLLNAEKSIYFYALFFSFFVFSIPCSYKKPVVQFA